VQSSGHVGAAPAFSVDVGTGLEAAHQVTAILSAATATMVLAKALTASSGVTAC
jgi:hypothetical protein